MGKKITVTEAKQEEEAKKVGRLDAFLTTLFTVGSIAITELLGYLVTLVPLLDTWQGGKYRWMTIPLGIVVGAVVKGIDRRMHESPQERSGLIKL